MKIQKNCSIYLSIILMLGAVTYGMASVSGNVSQNVRGQGLSPVTISDQTEITITTQKPFGPVPGTFVTSGAFADSGVLVTESRVVGAIPSPWGVVSNILLRFEGQHGTFWMRTQIIETATADELIFANEGQWVIVDGTGPYSTLHGTGDMEGTADHGEDLITRVYTGLVHF